MTYDSGHPSWYAEQRSGVTHGRVHILELEVGREQVEAWRGGTQKARLYLHSPSQLIQGYMLQLNLTLFPGNARVGLSMFVGLPWPGMLQGSGLMKVGSAVFEHQALGTEPGCSTWAHGVEMEEQFVGNPINGALNWHPVQSYLLPVSAWEALPEGRLRFRAIVTAS